MLLKVSLPLNVLLSPRSVELALVVGRHEPLIAKQPAVMLTPFATVVLPVFDMEKRVVVAGCSEN